MTLFRFFAWTMLALAVGLLGADALSSLEQGETIIRSTAQILALFGIDGLGLAGTAPDGLRQALNTMMGIPLWSIFGILGIVLALIFRPIE